jgi:hypothetical protein
MKINVTKNINNCIYSKGISLIIKVRGSETFTKHAYEGVDTIEEFDKIVNGEYFAIDGQDIPMDLPFSTNNVKFTPGTLYVFYRTPKEKLIPVRITASQKTLRDAARAMKKFGHLSPDNEIDI